MIIRKLRKKSLLLFLIPFLFWGVALAKYMTTKNQNLLYEAQAFYFESDLLNDNTNQISYTYPKGSDSVSFILKNNTDELRYSEVTIDYKVSITDISGNNIKDKNGDTISEIEGSLDKGQINSTEIEFNDLNPGVYTITAEAIKPYKKQLKANFILSESIYDIDYTINDAKDSPVLNLTINTEDYQGELKISWPKGVVPDNTDPFFENINSGYQAANTTITFNSNSEYVFLFFKEDASNVYTTSDFEVKGVD